jgi:hypothetical protein
MKEEHMKLNKKLVALAAAGVLSGLTALPAMAFENEFHGTYTLKAIVGNYEVAGGGNPLVPAASGYIAPPGALTAYNTSANLKTQSYIDQRARIFYTAKASDDLKLVTGFEIDAVFGDKSQGQTTGAAVPAGTGRNQGGGIESDTVNLETKWVYLQFKVPSTPTTVLAGIMPFKDSIKGILADFDAAGIVTSSKLGNATVNAGWFRGYDQSFFATGTAALQKGNSTLDIGAIELKYDVSKDVKAGLVYYIYGDGRATNYGGALATNYAASSTAGLFTPAGTANTYNGNIFETAGVATSATMLHTFGLTGEAKVGAATVSGFFAYQGGLVKNVGGGKDTYYLNAAAYNVAAKAAAGPGTFKTALLFTSGNDGNAVAKKHLTGWVGTSQSGDAVWGSTTGTCTYNESGMMLLNRNALNAPTTTDVSIIYNTSNGTTPVNAQGMYLYTLGYDATITPKLYTNVNAGAAWVAHTNSLKPVDYKTGKQNATNYMGAEINLETGYKLYDSLTAKFQAAYVVLGGYYKGSSAYSATAKKAVDPENPYTARIILSYAF